MEWLDSWMFDAWGVCMDIFIISIWNAFDKTWNKLNLETDNIYKV